MIIDSHVHLLAQDWLGEGFWNGFVWLVSRVSGRDEERIRKILPSMWDPQAESLFRDMAEAGIDSSVIFPIDYGLTPSVGEAAVPIADINKAYASLARAYPDRLVALVGVDPRRKEAPSLVETAVRDWGMRGLKLHPGADFSPSDEAAYPLYELVAQHNLPVVTHTGPVGQPLYSRYAQPIHLDKAAADFPQVNFIAAHMGYGWYHEAVAIASAKPNIYLDFAGWQLEAVRNPGEFFSALRFVLDKLGKDRVLFGSDWPFFRRVMGHDKWQTLVKELPRHGQEAGLRFTEDEVKAMTGENAKRLFGLK
ncbi:MAG: amidohydrolase [Chloroflexi bacterium]|nr:amidohydrolase [Chloroflexota bacterium]